MKTTPLETNNIFEDAHRQFNKDADFERLREKYRLKSYHESKKNLATVVYGASFMLNIISIATATGCVVQLLHFPLIPSIIGAVLFLALLEGIKRETIPDAFKAWLQFSKISVLNIGAIVLLFALSCALSYRGAHIGIKHFTPSPETISISAIETDFKARAAVFHANIERAEKMTWKKRITRKGSAIIKDAQTSLAALELAKIEAVKTAQNNNSNTMQAHNDKTANKAYFGAFLALFCDVSLLLCFWYLEFYDFRSFAEFAAPKTTRFVKHEPVPPTNIPKELVQPISATETRWRNIPDEILKQIETPEISKVSKQLLHVSGFKPLTVSEAKSKLKQYEWKLKKGKGKAETAKANILKLRKALKDV
jgi:hypothetical protein